MIKEVNGIMFENVEIFDNFLKDNLKNDFYLLDEFLKDVIYQFGNTSMNCYELSKFMTFSGNPQQIDFEVEYFENDDITNLVIYF